MAWTRVKLSIQTARMTLRLPVMADFGNWSALRAESADYLTPWEPSWLRDHLTQKGFANRVSWAKQSLRAGTAVPLFLERNEDHTIVGAITMENIRRGPVQTATIGYWTGQRFARQGYMKEAIDAVVYHAFHNMDLSRIEAACLPDNKASRGLLEKSGFKYEGVAQSYLQINGRWRNHVLYAALRSDRRGKTDIG